MRQCWDKVIGVISIQVLCEFFVEATRAGSPIISLEDTKSDTKSIIENLVL